MVEDADQDQQKTTGARVKKTMGNPGRSQGGTPSRNTRTQAHDRVDEGWSYGGDLLVEVETQT